MLERAHSSSGALGLALAFSVAFTGLVLGWFAAAIAEYTSAPAWLGWCALLVLAPLLQPQTFVFVVVRSWLRTRGAGSAFVALASASAWIFTEHALPKLLGDSLGLGCTRLRRCAKARTSRVCPGSRSSCCS